ncbi:hypothetical protein MKX03_033266, partial [Papaver bracteatum]
EFSVICLTGMVKRYGFGLYSSSFKGNRSQSQTLCGRAYPDFEGYSSLDKNRSNSIEQFNSIAAVVE